MATATRRPVLTDGERAAKRAAETELVAAAVEQLRTSEGWTQWVATRSRFHRYSFGNQMLIAFQHPTAKHVAGFRKWLELGYCVRKGEHGLRIWAPCPPSKAKLAAWESSRAAASKSAGVELDGVRPRTFFRLTAVFAQDQVEELPPPAVPVSLTPPIHEVDGDDLALMLDPLISFAQSIGSDVVRNADLGNARGCYSHTRQITLAAGLTANGEVKTLVHEIAHALVHGSDTPEVQLSYAMEELIVESVAMSVCGTLGLDTSDYSLGYLCSWSEKTDIDLIKRSAALVNELASRIEDAALDI